MSKHYIKLLTFFIIFVFFAFKSTTTTTKVYPQNYFRSPINTPIKLSGTFGELRSNHLHSGIDIKSDNGKSGQPILAIADGYVSRIKVQSGGYGNVLYINHPNGYTSVYAHLSNFPKKIAEFVKKEQKRKKRFEIELYPSTNQFQVTKGERIGKMGTSGRSFGPHLHFEIRDTKTEKPINPLLFGLEAKDNRAPKLHELKIYSLNDKLETLDTKNFNLKKIGNDYQLKGKDTLSIGAWRIGIGLKAYDQMSLASNWNGIYKLDLYKDGQPVYGFEMETFPFSETRYINAHLDYEEQVTDKSYINRCYSLPGNKLSIYNHIKEKGIIKLSKSKATEILLKVEDIEGNKTSLQFWVKRANVPEPKSKSFNYLLPYNDANQINNGNFSLYMSKGTLYENLYLNYGSSVENSALTYSPIHHVHDYKTPVHRYYELGIMPVGLPDNLKSQAFIAYCQPNNKVISCGGKWENGELKTKVRDLGDFYIMVDLEKPTIKPHKFSTNMSGYNYMSFKVDDNFDTAPNLDKITYDAYLDGQWIVMEYDAKNDLLIHHFEDNLPKGDHQFQLIVKDAQGNEAVFERNFRR